jgi:glycosyltransferase involved in cell wall biosynthesis
VNDFHRVPLNATEQSGRTDPPLALARDAAEDALVNLRPSQHLPERDYDADVAAQATTFVLLAFEGPDAYARAGGLAVRVSELGQALAEAGHTVHLIFVGDPELPGHEVLFQDRLILHRWCQWISQYHPEGVYAGEEGKWRDYTESVPPFVVDQLVGPALAAGGHIVILGEEWHTAEAMCNISDRLWQAGVREQAVLLWNANNTMGFSRIDWARLRMTCTITTVSRYMKHLLWDLGVDPLVVPNGIPQRLLGPIDEVIVSRVRQSFGQGPVLLKIARWDPDKRWRLAVEIVTRLKAADLPVRLVARGGLEAHGVEVLEYAQQLGLQVHDVALEQHADLGDVFAHAPNADVLNVTTPMTADTLRVLYRAADGVLANSGREPFGLVGLEAMAAGGTAFTGNTGEEYAQHMHNAVVLDTADPSEAAWYVSYLVHHPDVQERLRARARATACHFSWDHVVRQLCARVQVLAVRKPGRVGRSPRPS